MRRGVGCTGPAPQTACTCRREPAAGCLPPAPCVPTWDRPCIPHNRAALCPSVCSSEAPNLQSTFCSPLLLSPGPTAPIPVPSPPVPSPWCSRVPGGAQSQQSGAEGLQGHGLQPLVPVHDHSWPSLCTYYVLQLLLLLMTLCSRYCYAPFFL